MAFKLSQEFPTASLNITKLSKTAAQYTSIPHSAQLSTPPFHIPRSSDRAAVGLPTAFHSLPSLRLLRGLSCSMCEPTVISLSFESFHHQLQYPLSLHQINTALLSFLVAALQSTALDSPIFLYWRRVLSVPRYFSFPLSLSSIHHKCGRYKFGQQRMC